MAGHLFNRMRLKQSTSSSLGSYVIYMVKSLKPFICLEKFRAIASVQAGEVRHRGTHVHTRYEIMSVA